MSGGSVGGVAVVGAAGGVAVLGVAAAAGLYVAARGTAFAVGGTMAAVGRHLEHQQERRDQLRADQERWERAVRDVATRNARIGVLAEMQASVASESAEADRPALPAPLVLGRQGLAELARWCGEVDAALATAEARVVERSTRALLRRASAGANLQRLATAQDVLDAEESAERPGWDREPIMSRLARLIDRLDVAARPDERDGVAAAAQRVLEAPSRTEARNRLDDVQVRLSRANAAAARRSRDAVEAAALLQPLALTGGSARPLRDTLREVVAGRRSLTPDLVQQAQELTAAVQAEADRTYLRRCVTESLAELGYVVDEGFQTAFPHGGALHVRRNGWAAHGVRVLLDEQAGELRAVVVRTESGTGWDGSRVDTEREKQWCADLERLADNLAAKGIRYDIRSRTDPGTRAVPLVTTPSRPARTRQTPRTLGQDPS